MNTTRGEIRTQLEKFVLPNKQINGKQEHIHLTPKCSKKTSLLAVIFTHRHSNLNQLASSSCLASRMALALAAEAW